MVLPVAPIERIIREAGGERVSEDAAKALAEVLYAYGISIAKRAAKFAKHAGRKTVTGEDIRLAKSEE